MTLIGPLKINWSKTGKCWEEKDSPHRGQTGNKGEIGQRWAEKNNNTLLRLKYVS